MNKLQLIALLKKDKPVILDIGCYDGKDSKQLADVWNTEVHCFEPDPLSQDIFIANHGNDKRLKLYGCALSDVDGEIEFYQSNHPQSNSIKEPLEHLNVFPTIKFDEKITVTSQRLDTWYRHVLRDKTIDFIWADVNGAEHDLIKGGQIALANTRYLYIETAKTELYLNQQHYSFLERDLPDFKILFMDNWGANFGNILLKNKTYDVVSSSRTF